MQYGVNHLGHFMLTSLLWNKIKKSSYFRVINVSSMAHLYVTGFTKKVTLDFKNINFETGYHDFLAYSRSKLYNVLFTKALA
jgi:NAD(P)-dependent dehydrogenase (short-subunit alcohol dehydrogenase family)